jgi:hypothetical protein
MGLLDDAIREHLDLKRRRGADPAEIERDEREALGPVRRAPEPQEAEEPQLAQPMPYDDQESAEDHDELGWDDGFADDGGEFEPFDHTADAQEPLASEPQEPPPPRAASRPEEQPTQHLSVPDFEAEDEFVQPSRAATPPPHPAGPSAPEEPPTHSRRPADHAGGETVEYEVEEEFAEDKPPKGGKDEDVLEETPEFLQDTPDHDRLWFEQRPPKDFDFDG